MQNILIAGAGKSASWVIDYMLRNAKNQWQVIVMDANADLIHEKLNNHPKGIAAVVDIHDEATRQHLVKQADIVLSLMPPHLHILLAQDCLKFGKNLITSSYASDDMLAMDEAVRKAGLMFMCEMGLDPGIDHMSAAQMIQGIHRIAGVVTSFKSSCGGLVAPESDDNPWQYKIAWNPRNIVLAGKAGAVWKDSGKIHEIAYPEVFEHPKKIKIPNLGVLAAYPNRDSLKYQNIYQIHDVKTLVRATLRYPAFIKGWDYIIKAGLTDENDAIDAEELTYSAWVALKTGLTDDDRLTDNFKQKYQADAKTMKMLEWLRIFEPRLINGSKSTDSATILQELLERRWKMRPTDKDMVVMQHEVEYERKGQNNKVTATLVVIGEDKLYSAMAKTVGLPMGILAKKILKGEIDPQGLQGVQIPVIPEVFNPVLRELKKHGIEFIEDLN
ncbi:MAG TPA: saccharopine dehydrogenase C-terminal domain-containing protein [Edaphocola sp.]|nr:saccharopine dehydrogenase C-terminal domain-containing protein [Edaphocola sp.]